jgi:hypothetical protein
MSHYLNIHFNIILPRGLFYSAFHTKSLYAPLLSPILATCPVPLILLDPIACIIFGERTTDVFNNNPLRILRGFKLIENKCGFLTGNLFVYYSIVDSM